MHCPNGSAKPCCAAWSTGRRWASALLLGASLAGCSPTVKIAAPKDPIVINLNVKIEQEVRVRVEKDLENLFENNDKIF